MDPGRERERQAALDSYDMVDTEPDAFYDGIVTLAASACECPIALVTFVDRGRQWFKAGLGMDVRETSREVAFCSHAVASGELFVVENALEDSRFVDNALVLGSPHIRFYAGEPFFSSDSHPLGTVCVIDRKPRTLSAAQRRVLVTLAREVEHQLSLRRALMQAELVGVERSNLAAMFAHDLRNPLQVATMSVNELRLRLNGDHASQVALADLARALQGMQRLAVDMLDLSAAGAGKLRVRLGRVDVSALFADVRACAAQVAGPGQRILLSTDLAVSSVRTDRDLVRRIGDNLLSNALKYSPESGRVDLHVRTDDCGGLSLTVRDEGPGIPESEREHVFAPYARLERDRDVHARASYGLGLPLCRAAAQALGGRIWVESGASGGAVFRLELPPVLSAGLACA